MAELTSHEVQQLVALRLTLEAADHQARAAGRYRRGAAVVALDAAVERACALVAVARGISIPANGKLDDLVSRLKGSLAEEWNPKVLPDIRQLRRARNAAQHEGLEPDREQLPLWAGAVDSLVSGLIQVQYEVDLRSITIADAVRDPELRGLLAGAERARNVGDAGTAVHEAAEAYRVAARRWKRLRAYNQRVSSLSRQKSLTRDVEAEVAILRESLDAGLFAANAGEAEWFMKAIAERGEVLDLDDADRAVSFAFQWILGFEAVALTWVPDRRHRAAIKARLERRQDGQPAQIDACLDVTLEHGRAQARLRLKDLPPREIYDEWARHLQQALRAFSGGVTFYVQLDGTVDLVQRGERVDDLVQATEVLAVALRTVEQDMNRAAVEATEAREREFERKRRYDTSVVAYPEPWPSWIEGIFWEPSHRSARDSSRWVLHVTPVAASLRIGSRQDGQDSREGIADLLRQDELVAQCYGLGSLSHIALEPLLSLPELHAVLTRADFAVQESLAAQAHHVREMASTRLQLRARIEEVIDGREPL